LNKFRLTCLHLQFHALKVKDSSSMRLYKIIKEDRIRNKRNVRTYLDRSIARPHEQCFRTRPWYLSRIEEPFPLLYGLRKRHLEDLRSESSTSTCHLRPIPEQYQTRLKLTQQREALSLELAVRFEHESTMRTVAKGMQCHGRRSVGIETTGTQRNAGMKHLSWTLAIATSHAQAQKTSGNLSAWSLSNARYFSVCS
jgi:hypothetical protein